MNKCIEIGNLTKDPELSETSSGVKVCKFTIAVNRNFTNGNGERECDFFNVVAWRGLAENCYNFLSKGKKVAVVGAMQTRSYKNDEGEKKYVTELVADEVEFLSPKDESDKPEPKQEKKKSRFADVGDGDYPF